MAVTMAAQHNEALDSDEALGGGGILATGDYSPTSEVYWLLIQEHNRESEHGPEGVHPRGQHHEVQEAWRPRKHIKVASKRENHP